MQFSVTIPTCHRNDLLAKCLDCLAPGQQSDAQIDWESRNVGTDIAKSGHGILVGESPDLAFSSYEVIVSDDGTKSTAEQMILERYPWTRWVAGPRCGPAANRNNGARNAVGDWLAFIDDDCIPDSGWLYNLHKCIGTGPWKVVEGMTTIPDRHDSPFLHAVEITTGGNYWSCNLAVKRDVYNSLGGFDEDIVIAGGEDQEFAWRFQQASIPSTFCLGALVFHPQRRYSLRAYCKRIWDLKWSRLCALKTGQSPSESFGKIRIAWGIAYGRIFQVVRNIVYLPRNNSSKPPSNQ
jgi:GT2 family glycosyltransferase